MKKAVISQLFYFVEKTTITATNMRLYMVVFCLFVVVWKNVIMTSKMDYEINHSPLSISIQNSN